MGTSNHSITGNPVKVFSPAIASVNNLGLHFYPKQEGSGDPSISNVRNITGMTSLNGYKAGDNVLPFEEVIPENYTNTLDGVTITYSNGVAHIEGTHNKSGWTNIASFDRAWANNPIQLPAGKYTISRSTTSYFNFCVCCKIDGAPIANKANLFTANQSVEVYGFYLAVKDEYTFDHYCPLVMRQGSYIPTEYSPYTPVDTIPVTFQSTGKNLFNPVNVLNAYVGTKIVSGSTYRTAIIPVRTGKTYTISKSSGNRLRVAFTTNAPQIGDDVFGFISNDTLNLTVTVPDNANYMCVYCVLTGEDANTILSTLQVEIGSVATNYVQYDPSITCYGGYADPADGTLTVEYVMKESTWGETKIANPDETTGYQWGYVYFDDPIITNGNGATSSNSFCNVGKLYWSGPDAAFDHFYLVYDSRISRYRANVILHKDTPDNTYIKVVAKLVIPYKVPLTQQEIKTLKGSTTFWSSALEDVSISYDVIESNEMMRARKRAITSNPKLEVAMPQDINAISFNTDTRSYLKDCTTMFYPVQEGTGDPSPTNVRPVTGKNILRLRHTGKNMFPIIGFSTSTVSSKAVSSYALTNNYGTSIDTVFGSSGQVVITQSETPLPDTLSSYRNGYVCFTLDGIEFDKTYILSFDVADITSNPLNASLSDLAVYSPMDPQQRIAIIGNRLVYLYNHSRNPSGRCSIEIRICGMSFTLKNIMISDINNSDYTYEPYVPIMGKNIAKIMGYSATTGGNNRTNSYGTSLNTVQFIGPDTPLIVTQSQAPETSNPAHYRNGYFCIDVAGLEFGKKYSLSFRVSDIKSNPLNATLSDIKVCNPYGSHYSPVVSSDGRITLTNFEYKQNQNSPNITSIDIRNCGMSFTVSEFMATEDGVDQTYEPCVNNTYYIDMPYIGRNLFPCREEDMVSDGWNRYFPNPFPEAGTYTISCIARFGGNYEKGCALAFTDGASNQSTVIGNTYLSYTFGVDTSTNGRKRTITITQEQANAPYIVFLMNSSGSTYNTFKYACIQIEHGSTKTFYTPYNDNTIYGAAVDIVHGIVAVTHMYTELAAVNRYENANYFFTTSGELAVGIIAGTNAELMCNRLKSKINTTETDTDPVMSFYANGIIRWVDPDYLSVTSANDYNDATASNRVKIVYQLANPIVVQIEPQQIKSLLGNNTFSAEGNSMVAVRYWKH